MSQCRLLAFWLRLGLGRGRIAMMIIAAPTVTMPTDNEYDIPVLRMDMQGAAEHPFTPWGSVARTGKMTGTWHFYVDDSRFSALEKDPLQLLATSCKQCVEPNISLFDSTPRAYAIWATYRKRAASRAWQDAGLGIVVDLCVPREFATLNLTGVPRGWLAYATRGFAGREGDVEQEHQVAIDHGGPRATLLVYGGGKSVRELCRSLPNAIYIEQFQDTRRRTNG